MTNTELRQLLLDIAVNCTRVGNWIADDYAGKKGRVLLFLDQTRVYIDRVSPDALPPGAQMVFRKFVSEYPALYDEARHQPKDCARFAERLMTWGSVLTHRSSLL